MDKIQRATEIHRSMTPHQMALRIVEMEDESAAAIEAMNMAREVIDEGTAKLEEYNAKLAEYDKRITELLEALELAEEAVRAKHVPDIAKMVLDGWQQQVFELCNDVMMSRLPMTEAMTNCMYQSTGDRNKYPNAADWLARAAISSAPKLGGE